MIKRLFIDVETTGLDPKLNGIRQISGIIEIDGKEVERFDFKVRPFKNDIIEQSALDISGVTKADLMTYDPADIVQSELLEIFGKHVDKYDKSDKFYFIAYNSPFDNNFMREWFKKLNDKYFGSWFHHDICVMRKAVDVHSNTGIILKSYSLSSVAEYYKVAKADDERWHDSMFDAEVTRGVYNILNKV